VLSAAEIARMTGLTARTVNAKLSAGGIRPVGRANRTLQYRDVDVAPIVDRIRVPTPYRIAIAHRKGGQAKTTTTFYLGRELAARGQPRHIARY
jgi:hypothetical protein